MAHPYHMHREHQVSHRRVAPLLKEEPAGAKQHNDSRAFSKVTSKTAAENHDDGIGGNRAPSRFARGGKVKGHQTNIAIVMPNRSPETPPPNLPGGPPAGPPMGPPPMGGPALPPGGPPPGLPMRAKGGRVIAGEDTKSNQRAWADRAKTNSFFRGGAASGVGREEKAEHQKRRK